LKPRRTASRAPPEGPRRIVVEAALVQDAQPPLDQILEAADPIDHLASLPRRGGIDRETRALTAEVAALDVLGQAARLDFGSAPGLS
jgi:hypothetical protein